ncbi:bifunctional adenosylcobinamide kinase/adenosylcobinamide-phosphate guanylyltransferase [Alkalibacter saccharofermentans]|uniref:Adenosylcobinamide kinase n=1 Tax=Alkalibacter saccharofermentans DSM 14828 TaxID=1120975 RepID=A0A1M4XEF2_9FIRM|nr:bifunctional adenosylcobinamide kinase/adenosylcobinamide-phosphate guanylyltransferase [Alkalibacter saccharofermentans]SHE91801.1 adenosylcobinamide kinase /adenosylcobinamide-phosphate guanylyltransferase [Alkalibacter saccharofermentans DSM 14828]
MGKITLVTGGARSGKSTFAENRAREKEKVAYIATSIPFDEGMAHRIKKHREQRPNSWITVEKHKDFNSLTLTPEIKDCGLFLVDCLTVMITNLMFYSGLDFDTCSHEQVDDLELEIKKEVDSLLNLALDKDMIIVTNELGMGLVPAYKMGSYFRDIAGRMNQLVAQRADEVYFIVSGIEIKIK